MSNLTPQSFSNWTRLWLVLLEKIISSNIRDLNGHSTFPTVGEVFIQPRWAILQKCPGSPSCWSHLSPMSVNVDKGGKSYPSAFPHNCLGSVWSKKKVPTVPSEQWQPTRSETFITVVFHFDMRIPWVPINCIVSNNKFVHFENGYIRPEYSLISEKSGAVFHLSMNISQNHSSAWIVFWLAWKRWGQSSFKSKNEANDEFLKFLTIVADLGNLPVYLVVYLVDLDRLWVSSSYDSRSWKFIKQFLQTDHVRDNIAFVTVLN